MSSQQGSRGREWLWPPDDTDVEEQPADANAGLASLGFIKGAIRRNVRFSDRSKPFMLDKNSWHELKMAVQGADFKAWLDGQLALEYTLGSRPGPGRGGAAPNPDLNPDNNPVLRPPVSGKIGLWSKTDSTSYFKDFVVTPKQ